MEGLCIQNFETNQLLSLPRLLNNRMLRLRQQVLSRPKRNRDQMVNLRQNLFGSPDKREENLRFAQDEMDKMTQDDCRRWNFDIDAGVPMEGQYHWELLNETNKALDTSGRLTCLTTNNFASSSSNKSSSPINGAASSFVSSSKNYFASSLLPPSSPSSASSSSSSSSPNSKRAVTTTTFSTTTTPTAMISKKCLKRLQQKSAPNKVPKLITDYFKEIKPVSVCRKGKDVIAEEKDVVSNRLVEILKIRSMNVR